MMKVKQRWQNLTTKEREYVFYIITFWVIMFSASLIHQQFTLPEINPALFIRSELLWIYDLSGLMLLCGFSFSLFFFGMFIESVRKHD